MGRKTKYCAEFDHLAAVAAELGATAFDLGRMFSVNEKMIDRWVKKYPSFGKAVKDARLKADNKVERSLYERATGYNHPSVKIFKTSDDRALEVPFTEHYAPDVTACIFWLKNRQPDRWKDRMEQYLGLAKTEEANPKLIAAAQKIAARLFADERSHPNGETVPVSHLRNGSSGN